MSHYIEVELASENVVEVEGRREHSGSDQLKASANYCDQRYSERPYPSSPLKGPANVSPSGLMMVDPPAIMMPDGSRSPSMGWSEGKSCIVYLQRLSLS